MACWENENKQTKQSCDRNGPMTAASGIPWAWDCVGVFIIELIMKLKGLRCETSS